MAIYRVTGDAITPLQPTSYSDQGLLERGDLQRRLRDCIEVIDPDVLVIAEEFSDWEDSRRRIDLLGVDRTGKLVVFELKRDEDGGHMELQAIRYAAMVSTLTFDQAEGAFQSYLTKRGKNGIARDLLLEFLEWDEPRKGAFAQDVRIILVSANFSREVTSTVLWLNGRGLDIECVRMKPYDSGQGVLVDVQSIIPLPEAHEFQEKVSIKDRERREDTEQDTGYWYMNAGDSNDEGCHRTWEDCRKYGFMLAGGGRRWTEAVKRLQKGDLLFAYLSRHGYVGYGEVVTEEAVPLKDFTPPGYDKPLHALSLTAPFRDRQLNDPEFWDVCVGVRWIRTFGREDAVLRSRARMGTLSRIYQPDLAADLERAFRPDGASK